MSGSGPLLASAFARELLRPRRLALPLGCALVTLAVAVFVTRATPPEAAADVTVLVIRELLLGLVTPLVSLTYAMAVVGDATDQGTIAWVFYRPVSRTTFLLSRGLTAFLMAGLVQLPVFLALPALLPTSTIGMERVATLPLVGLAGTLAYVCLYLLMSVMVRRAFVLGLLHVVLIELALGLIPGKVGYLTIRAHLYNLLGISAQGDGLLERLLADPIPSADSAATLATVVILCSAAAWALFQRKPLDAAPAGDGTPR